ncbi:MAG TPA: hypothetical protein DEP72_00415 [Clostridiales bacterium]|nr:MAG: hypothetical protein A2Y18_01000 [Clostridiales bacterium GWD2_32_19]HCC06614.1 hypothetical protein [Clostridiales bacterium]
MQNNMGMNNTIAVTLFFILLPFIMLFMDQNNSKMKVFLVIVTYVAILGAFYTGYIYTTPVGEWIEKVAKSLSIG